MGKDPSRKPPKREPLRELDDDLVELASVIAEHKLDNDASGWFELPWHSGWNAAQLCKSIGDGDEQGAPDFRAHLSAKLGHWLRTRESNNDVYWQVDELRMLIGGNSTLFARAYATALRCITVLIARSHGGGHVYNDILRRLMDHENVYSAMIETHVLEARCFDAIGVGPSLMNDRFDRQRRAFRIAWERGLYHAAYAIGPVKR